MNRLRRLCGLLLSGLLLSVSGMSTAQDKLPEEQTRPSIPRGFRMYLVSDGRFGPKDDRNRVGKLHDPVAEYGLNTVVGVFVRGIPKDKDVEPVAAILKKQQELAEKFRFHRFGTFMAFLGLTKDFAADDNRDALINQVNTIAKGANTPLVQIGLAELTLDKDEVPPQVAAWKIGADDAITIVLCHRFKEVKRWKFKAGAPPTEKDLDDVANAVAVVLGKKKAE